MKQNIHRWFIDRDQFLHRLVWTFNSHQFHVCYTHTYPNYSHKITLEKQLEDFRTKGDIKSANGDNNVETLEVNDNDRKVECEDMEMA